LLSCRPDGIPYQYQRCINYPHEKDCVINQTTIVVGSTATEETQQTMYTLTMPDALSPSIRMNLGRDRLGQYHVCPQAG
jgi:hypothetical protein